MKPEAEAEAHTAMTRAPQPFELAEAPDKEELT